MSHVPTAPKATEQDVYSARLRACDATLGCSYLNYGLLSIIPIITDKGPTCATDRYWRLYVNPNFFATLTPDQGALVLVHEVWHLLLEHARRSDNFGITVEEHDLWNAAGDMEINQHDEISKRLPKPITYDTFKLPPNLLAEEYFMLLRQKLKKFSINVPMPGAGACGSCAHGHAGDYELPAPGPDGKGGKIPGLAEDRGKLIAEEVAREIQTASKSRGDMPAGWARWADKTLTPQVDYRTFLRQSIQGQIISKSGYAYPSYRKPGRRQHISPDLLRPYYKDIQPHVAMIIDTSGSMSDRMVGQGLAEVDGALKALSSKAEIAVYFTDAAAAAAQKVTCTKDLRPIGGGGTDMREGFDAIDRNCKKNPGSEPSTIIVVTDGYTPWPDKPPSYANVLIVLVGEGDSAPWAKPPKHATVKLKIPEPPVTRTR